MRLTLLALLAALTVLTNLAAGAARGHADPAGGIVICTGSGPVMVYLDETGDPTGPPVLCPDGIAALFHAALAAPPEARPVLREIRLVHPAPVVPVARVAALEARSRSPPAPAG